MEDPTQRRLQRKGERCRGGVGEYTLLELLERKQQAGMQRRQKFSREEIGRK